MCVGVGERFHCETVRWQGGGKRKRKHFERTLSLQFLAMQSERWLNSDWGLKLGGNSACAGSEKQGSQQGHDFFLKVSSVRFQDRHGRRENYSECCGRISLRDAQRFSNASAQCQSVAQDAASLSLFMSLIIAFIFHLFSLPLLPGASAHIPAAAIQPCGASGVLNHFTLRQSIIIPGTNEEKITQ